MSVTEGGRKNNEMGAARHGLSLLKIDAVQASTMMTYPFFVSYKYTLTHPWRVGN